MSAVFEISSQFKFLDSFVFILVIQVKFTRYRIFKDTEVGGYFYRARETGVGRSELS